MNILLAQLHVFHAVLVVNLVWGMKETTLITNQIPIAGSRFIIFLTYIVLMVVNTITIYKYFNVNSHLNKTHVPMKKVKHHPAICHILTNLDIFSSA